MKLIKYNIYTEDINRKGILDLLNNAYVIKGYNLQELTGYWQGKTEKSLKIEIISDITFFDTVSGLAYDIKILNRQEAILLTQENIKSYLL